MIAQGFHIHLGAFSDHELVIIPTTFLCPDPLKLVHALVDTIFLTQLAFEWIVFHIWRCAGTHDFSVGTHALPGMATATGTQSVLMAAMLPSVRAKIIRKSGLQLVPSVWKVLICVPVPLVRNVASLADVHNLGVGFAIRRVVA
jgi:hypothetical protein